MTTSPKYPSLTPKKKIEELRTCKSCGLTVMAKGDWHGWKGIDVGGGQLDWFCDKLLCRQARDETISRRSRELLLEQQQNERLGAENRELAAARQRIAELERENATLKARQTNAREPEPVAEVVADPSEPAGYDAPVMMHIVIHDGGLPLCGAGANAPAVRPGDMTWDMNPCQSCSTMWAKIQTGEMKAPGPPVQPSDPRIVFSANVPSSDASGVAYRVALGQGGEWTCECEAFKYRKMCKHIAAGQKLHGDTAARSIEQPLAAPEPRVATPAASALYGEKPTIPRLEDLPRFTPDLITAIQANPDSFIGRAVLIKPDAYPEMDLSVADLDSFRRGIGALTGLPVDRIEHAAQAGVFVGIVFTLRAPGH